MLKAKVDLDKFRKEIQILRVRIDSASAKLQMLEADLKKREDEIKESQTI